MGHKIFRLWNPTLRFEGVYERCHTYTVFGINVCTVYMYTFLIGFALFKIRKRCGLSVMPMSFSNVSSSKNRTSLISDKPFSAKLLKYSSKPTHFFNHSANYIIYHKNKTHTFVVREKILPFFHVFPLAVYIYVTQKHVFFS